MTNSGIYPGMLIVGLLVAAPAAQGQCGDARINDAFRQGLNRQPTAQECDPNRYAGGSFTSTSDLIPLVKASVVCSDPWVAQAYYKLGRQINGHDPTQLDGGRAGSTIDQCNYSLYGSWPDFPTLMRNVTNYSASTPRLPPAPTPTPSLQASITGPASLASGQQVTITWSYSGTPTQCGSGVSVMMSGGGLNNYVLARIPALSSRTFTFKMGDWSSSLRSVDTPVNLTLMDGCSTNLISGTYQSVISFPKLASLVYTPLPTAPTQGYAGPRLDSIGQLIGLDGKVIPGTGTGNYFLSVDSKGNLVAAGGGNYTAWVGGTAIMVTQTALQGALFSSNGTPYRLVAAGGGNLQLVPGGYLVAAGGGNLVAAGGGNIITNAGGNLVAAGGGNFTVMTTADVLRQSFISHNGSALISNDGSSLNPNWAKLVGNSGGTFTFGIVSTDSSSFNPSVTVRPYAAAAPPAQGKCGDPRINDAFQMGLNRQPTTQECTATRYAGGSFSSMTDLIPLVKASVVCSDPWVAQAYYKLGRQINGHDPTQLDGGRAGSTIDQCNYSLYGSWPDFPTLVRNVTNYSAAPPRLPPAPTPTASLQASITGPASLASGQQVTLTWSYSGTPTQCGSGVNVMMSGGGINNYVLARIPSLSSRTVTFKMGDWSSSLRSVDTPINLTLMDGCSTNVISGAYQSKISFPKIDLAFTVPATSPTLKYLGPRLDSSGRLMGLDGTAIPGTGTGNYFLSVDSNGSLVAAGGGNYTAWVGGMAIIVRPIAFQGTLISGNGTPYRLVAAGGGNLQLVPGGYLVAAGGGNLVAAGGGNLVAAGGGNLVAAGGGNFTVMTTADVLRQPFISHNGSALISNDGSSLNPNWAKLVGNSGGTFTFGIVSTDGSSSKPPVAGSTYKVLSAPTPPTQPMVVTGLSPSYFVWPNMTSVPVSWQYTGTPGADQYVNLVVRLSTGTEMRFGTSVLASSRKATLTAGNFSGTCPKGCSATLILKDAATGLILSYTPMTIRVP